MIKKFKGDKGYNYETFFIWKKNYKDFFKLRVNVKFLKNSEPSIVPTSLRPCAWVKDERCKISFFFNWDF